MIFLYKVGDYIVYKRDVCKVKEIKEKYYNNTDYYVLNPISDDSLRINVPVDNDKLLRSLITEEEVKLIIKNIPNIDIIDEDDKMLETIYKDLLKSENHEDLIKIIKTTYLRNKDRVDNNKKISEKDNTYFNLAERYLYTEFSVVLNKSFDDTRDYVISEVEKLI